MPHSTPAPANLVPLPSLQRQALTQSPYHGPAVETYKHDARSCVWRMRGGTGAEAEDESNDGANGAPGEHAECVEYVVKRFDYTPIRQRLGLLVGLHPAQLELRWNRALRTAGVPVAPIVDAGIEPMGIGCRVWLITPRLGTSLQRLLRDDRSSDAQRERWLLAAAALTRQLLRSGFTFRDLKPSNIVIDEHGDDARAHLLDVGSVRATTRPARVAKMLATMDRVLARDGMNEALRRRFAEAVEQPPA